MTEQEKQDQMRPYNICQGCGADYSEDIGVDSCPKCGRKVMLILSKPSQLAAKLAEAGIFNYKGKDSVGEKVYVSRIPL